MKKFKLYKGFLYSFVLFAAVSCNEIEYKPTGAADALIIALVTDSDTVYGIGLHAYTYDEFSKVIAYYKGAADEIFTLTPFNGYNNDLSYETPREQMTQGLPPVGEYIFEATFPSQEFITITDEVTSQVILPPVITQCGFNEQTDNIIVSWGEVLDDVVLTVKLYSLDRELLFISQALDPDVVIYSFGATTSGWQDVDLPEPGESFIVEISSYRFELLNGGSLNIQATGRIEKVITWGN